jgi:hypothetical protein
MPENIPVLGAFFQGIDKFFEHLNDGFRFSVKS